MSNIDQHTPGGDIIDLRDVQTERDHIWSALQTASEERDAKAIKHNQENPHEVHPEGCECTIAEMIEDGDYEKAWSSIVEDEALWVAAELDSTEHAFMEAVMELEFELHLSLEDAANNEPAMIHERYFTEHAEQLADDIGAIDRDAGWPLTYIDWEAAARDLKVDYTEVTFGGHTYYWRAC